MHRVELKDLPMLTSSEASSTFLMHRVELKVSHIKTPKLFKASGS